MKEPEYAVTKSDKIQRVASLMIMLFALGLEIIDGRLSVWYKFEAAPVFATAMIWFSDTFGTALPWTKAPRDVRVIGWAALILFAVLAIL